MAHLINNKHKMHIKLISILIAFIFSFEGVGYSVQDGACRTNLRVPVGVSRDRAQEVQKKTGHKQTELGASSSIPEMSNFLNLDSRDRFSSIIKAIEIIRGKQLNKYENQELGQFRLVIDELDELRYDLKKSELGFPEVCYQAVKKISRMLTEYGFRHKIYSSFNPAITDKVYLANFVTLNLAGVEFVLDVVNEAYSQEDVGTVLIPYKLVRSIDSSNPSYKYVMRYKWPSIVEAKIDREGVIKECVIRTIEKTPQDIIKAIKPKGLEWAMPSENKKQITSYVTLSPLHEGFVRAVMVITEFGNNQAELIISDIAEENVMLVGVSVERFRLWIDASMRQLVIDIPNKKLKALGGPHSEAWIPANQLFDPSSTDSTGFLNNISSNNANRQGI